MSEDVFDAQVLTDKLSKLNSSQQSIESLSKLCVSQRKKAKQIVEIWHKSFNKAQQEQQVSLLYLANDILQNSRRKGNEFTIEFWKVMPTALKQVNEHGGENGKKAASRLVVIWDERRVFGSRCQNLKDEMLGKTQTQLPSTIAKTPNPIKIVKRDANSLRLKLTVGGTPEKIMSAFHSVHDENSTEDTALNNCEAAVRRFGDLERDIETQGVVAGSSLVDEIQEQENVLKECVNQLETAEKTRASLISQLKVALQDQESKLDVIHSQLKVARHQIGHAANLRKKLVSPGAGEVTKVDNTQSTTMMFGSGEEENKKKAAAAAMAAKLAASTSSAQMLSSVLSSLVAEEAASISTGFNSATNIFPPEKRQKIETPPEYVFQPPPPPNQFIQTSGVVIQPYGYGGSSVPPPPPPVPMMPPHQQQQQSQPQPQQTSATGYYRPPGIGFYGQNHQPVPR